MTTITKEHLIVLERHYGGERVQKRAIYVGEGRIEEWTDKVTPRQKSVYNLFQLHRMHLEGEEESLVFESACVDANRYPVERAIKYSLRKHTNFILLNADTKKLLVDIIMGSK